MPPSLDQRIADMDAQIALPRQNGELVFQTPWEARAFGMAVALDENGAYGDWPQNFADVEFDADRSYLDAIAARRVEQ